MRFQKVCLPLLACLVLLACRTEARRVRVRTRPIQQESEQLIQESDSAEEDNRPEQAVQYYRADKRADNEDVVYVAADDDYNGGYGQTTIRSRADNIRPQAPAQRSSTVSVAPRSKSQQQNVERAPPVQTIRNYNKVNDDGSFTFGYEAADGSFKEETRGTDCVVRGKYGYIDPDGNKREFTYVSGNPCDPNNPDASEEEPDRSVEDSDENIPQNYPKRPVLAPRPVRPLQSTTRAPTTVFQNTYNHQNGVQDEEDDGSDEDTPQTVTIGPKARPTLRPVPQQHQIQTVTQRPRVQILNTTPSTVTVYSPRPSVNITPRPSYHSSSASPSHAPPATTYRPLTVSPKQEIATTPYSFVTPTKASSLLGSTRGSLDFDAEFKKFQHENQISSTPSSIAASPKYNLQKINTPVTNSPIYQSQLVFDPSSGQYDTQLYQQLPQSQGDFSVNHRIQPYVHQQQVQHRPAPQPQQQIHHQQHQQQPQFLSVDHLQQQSSPLYRHQLNQIQPAPPAPAAPIPQQIYQKQQNELQFHNSQQLFAQQLEFQQTQLHRDRVEAAKKVSPIQQQPHRFQIPGTHPQLQRQVQQPQQPFYYIQPQHPQNGGQIDAFLRGHNIEY